MDERGIERNGRAGGTTAEEIHRAALSDEPDRRLPGLRLADSLDDHIEDRAGRDGGHQPALFPHIQNQFCPEPLGDLEPLLAPSRHRYPAVHVPGQRDKHEANRARANHQHALSGAQTRVFDPLHHASQRLNQGRVAEIGLRLQAQQVLLHEP